MDQKGEGLRAIIKFSVTGNVTCPSLITFFPLIRWWGGGWGGLSQGVGSKFTAEVLVASCCSIGQQSSAGSDEVGGGHPLSRGPCKRGMESFVHSLPSPWSLSPEALFPNPMLSLPVSLFPCAGS